MKIAERLVELAGTGGQVQELLAIVGAGATIGAAVVGYSGLPSATVEQHLLATRQPQEEPGFAGGMTWRPYKRRPREEDEALLLAVLH